MIVAEVPHYIVFSHLSSLDFFRFMLTYTNSNATLCSQLNIL